mgnify:CR=1 FL=1
MKRIKLFTVVGMLLILVMLVTGCSGGFLKPYKKDLLVEVGPNESAIKVPREGENLQSQEKLEAIKYLKKNKASSKRVRIDQQWRKTGRPFLFMFDTNGFYIPKSQVLIVDRTPVNLKWTPDEDTGSSSQNQGISGEDCNSVSFSVEWSIVATIKEEDIYEYFYWYGADPDNPNHPARVLNRHGKKFKYAVWARPLKSVLDTEIRRMIGIEFMAETGGMNLDKIIKNKGEISKRIMDKIKKKYKKKGITITGGGWGKGITYEDKSVQEAINQEFIASRERRAQKERNKKKLEIAENQVKVAKQQRLAAEEKSKMWEIIYKEKMLELRKRQLEIIENKWDGKYPLFMMQGGNSSNMDMEIPLPEEFKKKMQDGVSSSSK